MKKLYTPILFLSLLFVGALDAQNIQYDLQCSSDGTSYEIYVSRDATSSVLFAGSSTITLVLPTGNSRTVSHTSESVSTYSAVTPIIDGNSTGNDYYAFNSSGGSSVASILTANTPVLWLTLTPSDGTNQLARLFINGTDPNNIGGVDASNVFSTLAPPPTGIVDEYDSNVSDTAINCSTLSVVETAELEELKVYPNPTTGILNVRGLNTIKSITIYNINGQQMRSFSEDTNLERIDISELQSGVYFVKLATANRSKTIKVIKE